MKRFISTGMMWILPVTLILGQQFVFHSMSPFGIQMVKADSSDVAFKYMFTDYDADGDLDLLLMGIDSISEELGFYYKGLFYFVDYQENTGDAHHPVFADRHPLISPFPFVEGLFFPAAGDLDQDGRPDLVVSTEIDKIGSQHLLYYRHLANGNLEVKRMDDMGIDPLRPYSVYQPELTDLDHDGDLDLLMVGYAPEFFDTTGLSSVTTFKYAKNIGNVTHPEFLGWFDNPFGLKADPPPSMFASGDIDLDGDVDIISIALADSITPFYFYENHPGGNGKPAFKNPVLCSFGLPAPEVDVSYLGPTLVDIDGDTDLDLFVFRSDNSDLSGLQYYENKLITAGIGPLEKAGERIHILPNPAGESMRIENTSNIPVKEIRIYDREGKWLRTVTTNLDKPVSLSGLDDGLYLIRLLLGNQQEIVKKVIRMSH